MFKAKTFGKLAFLLGKSVQVPFGILISKKYFHSREMCIKDQSWKIEVQKMISSAKTKEFQNLRANNSNFKKKVSFGERNGWQSQEV